MIDNNIFTENSCIVTLASNSDYDSFPNNTTNKFSCQLLRPLVGYTKVALLDITFQLENTVNNTNIPDNNDNVNNINTTTTSNSSVSNINSRNNEAVGSSNNSTALATTNSMPFFDISKNEDVIILTHIAEIMVEIHNMYTSVLPLLDEINTRMKAAKADFLLKPIISPKGVFVKMIYSDGLAPKFKANIPATLAKALGFDRTEFDAGTYISNEVVDDKYFRDNIEINELITIFFAGYTDREIKVDEPISDSVHDVVEVISDALMHHSIGVAVNDRILHVRIYNEFYSLQFSKRLNIFFGADANFKMTDADNVLFLPDKLFPTPIAPVIPSQQYKSLNKIFILSNLALPQQVSNSYMPYIQVLDMPSNTSSVISHKFQTPIYLNLRMDEITTVTISLETERSEAIRTGDYPSTVVLHFKN